FSSRRRHTRFSRDWSSDVCSSDLTDSDSRYCSFKYIELLDKSGAEISMCVGNAYENAHSESFNGTLKRQEINLNEYTSKEDSAKIGRASCRERVKILVLEIELIKL